MQYSVRSSYFAGLQQNKNLRKYRRMHSFWEQDCDCVVCFSLCRIQPILKFEILIREIESVVSDNDFQLCGTAEQRTESPLCLSSNKTPLSCSCMPAVPLRDLFWQDVFWGVAIALVYPGALCKRWINGHVRHVWCRRKEKDQFRNFPCMSAQALHCSLGLCKQSCLNYYCLRISWKKWKNL